MIEDLVEDLRPVYRSGKTGRMTLYWLVAALGTTIVLMLAHGPFRVGFITQLFEYPRFALESLCGFGAVIAVAIAAFRSAIPGPQRAITQTAIPLGFVAAWLLFYLYGLVEPALPPSMNGKREHCHLEVIFYGMPVLALGLVALRRLYPLRGAFSGFLIGLAAGAVPALLMQFACVYHVPHILLLHLLPALGLALIGAALGWMVLQTER